MNKNKFEESKHYWNNGNLNFHCKFKNGLRYGDQKWYADNGDIEYHWKCYDGKDQGIEIKYE